MTRLPNHWSVYAFPEKATAQTVPSVATTVAHILNRSPPFPPFETTVVSATLSFYQLGNSGQSAKAGQAKNERKAPVETGNNHLWTLIPPLPDVIGFTSTTCGLYYSRATPRDVTTYTAEPNVLNDLWSCESGLLRLPSLATSQEKTCADDT